tara:strand:- start:218 stop:508 length:291 start_codon:yes stop_codon:yes gene_type:complete
MDILKITLLISLIKYTYTYSFNSNFWGFKPQFSNLKWQPINLDEFQAYNQYIKNVNSNNYYNLNGYSSKSKFKKYMIKSQNETGIFKQEGEVSMYE